MVSFCFLKGEPVENKKLTTEDKGCIYIRVPHVAQYGNQSTDETLPFNKGKKEYIHIKISNSVRVCACLYVFSTHKNLSSCRTKKLYVWTHL